MVELARSTAEGGLEYYEGFRFFCRKWSLEWGASRSDAHTTVWVEVEDLSVHYFDHFTVSFIMATSASCLTSVRASTGGTTSNHLLSSSPFTTSTPPSVQCESIGAAPTEYLTNLALFGPGPGATLLPHTSLVVILKLTVTENQHSPTAGQSLVVKDQENNVSTLIQNNGLTYSPISVIRHPLDKEEEVPEEDMEMTFRSPATACDNCSHQDF